MLKRAVSPLIATVLVIGFVIALSGIMMTWGTSFVKDIQERSEKSSLKDIACTRDVGINIKSATVLGNKIKLVIENLGQMDIDKLNILLVGSDGGDNIETGSGISAGGIQSFSVALDPNKIGTFKQVEAMPSITFEGEQIACKDAVDKEENLAIDTDGLVAYYKLDGDAKDSAGNNNGNIFGNPVYGSGVFGKGLYFDGSGDYIEVSNSPSLNPDRISVELWAKSNTVNWNQDAFLVSKRDAYILAPVLGTKAIRFYIYYGGAWRSAVVSPPAEFDITKWHHYIGTYDGSIIKMIVDGGDYVGTASSPGMNILDTGALYMGWDDGIAGRFFSGVSD